MKLPLIILALFLALLAGCGKDEKPDTVTQPKPEPSEKPLAPTPDTPPKPPVPEPTPDPQAQPEPKKEMSALEKEVAELVPMPDIKPLEELVDNWNNVPEKAFPDQVTVNVEATYKLYVDGKEIGGSKSPPGHKAVPLKHKPGQLLLSNSPNGNTRAVVNVEDTDFKEQIEARYNEFVERTKERVMAMRKRARERLVRTAQAGDPESMEDGWHDPTDPRFQPVRDFLAAGKLESGLLEEADKWLWLGPERHDGMMYDAVLVHFNVETIFGVFPNTMKCLLRNGQVVKWIDPDSGEVRT